MNERPIGIFDSGLGGLTVVKELKQLLPNENLVYFGDTGRVPYGTRSRETIVEYAKQDINFLLSKNVKMVIAACGTVSAILPQTHIEQLPVPYTGVLLPAVQTACAITQIGRIGVIGTAATIQSGAYGKAIRSIRPNTVVVGNPCPLFVPLVENGYVARDNKVTRMVAEEYLQPFSNGEVDTLILGCTHFPLIRDIIRDVLGKDVRLVDPGKEAARYAASVLTKNNMLNQQAAPGVKQFYVSDSVESFTRSASLFLHDEVQDQVERATVSGE